MTTLRRRLAAGALAAGVAVSLTGCGTEDDDNYSGSYQQEDVYYPASFGNDDRGECYYVDDPSEVNILRADGDCDDDWRPVLIPQPVYLMYYPFYSSPGYYTTHLPKSRQSYYKSKAATFGRTYKSQIDAAQKTAPYVSNTGKKVTGDKVAKTKFGSGSRTSGGRGIRVCALGPIDLSAASVPLAGGSFGGGSRSSSPSVSSRSSSSSSSSSRPSGSSSRPSTGGGGSRNSTPKSSTNNRPNPKPGTPPKAPVKTRSC